MGNIEDGKKKIIGLEATAENDGVYMSDHAGGAAA
jgi:hypothetical protein